MPQETIRKSTKIATARSKTKKTPFLIERRLENHDKEVWFHSETIRTMISACVEMLEGRGIKNSANGAKAPIDKENIGLLFGEKHLRAKRRQIADRYVIKHAYILQIAKRYSKKVTWNSWRRKKMGRFFALNYGDEYLGKFHLHPGINHSRPSVADKRSMQYRKLDLIVFVKRKRLAPKGVAGKSGIEILASLDDYETISVSCLCALKSDGGGIDNYYVDFGINGWYRYTLNKKRYYAPVKLMLL